MPLPQQKSALKDAQVHLTRGDTVAILAEDRQVRNMTVNRAMKKYQIIGMGGNFDPFRELPTR